MGSISMQRRDRTVGIAICMSEAASAERVTGQSVVDVQEMARAVGIEAMTNARHRIGEGTSQECGGR